MEGKGKERREKKKRNGSGKYGDVNRCGWCMTHWREMQRFRVQNATRKSDDT
jgi:hypothetical protein